MAPSLFQKSQSAPLEHLICLVIALGQFIDVEGERGRKYGVWCGRKPEFKERKNIGKE